MSPQTLVQAHRAGRKHRRRVEAAAGRSTVKSSAHYCPLCEISTTSSAHLALHLVGRAHRRRQKALEEGESLHPVSLLQPTAAVFVSDSLGSPLTPSSIHRDQRDFAFAFASEGEPYCPGAKLLDRYSHPRMSIFQHRFLGYAV